jgi:hypothetical protein
MRRVGLNDRIYHPAPSFRSIFLERIIVSESVPSTQFNNDVVETMGLVVTVLEQQWRHLAHLEGHIAQLAKKPVVIVKRPGKALPFIAGAVAGVYLYRKFKQNIDKVELLIQNDSDAKKQDANRRKDGEATVIEGEVTPDDNMQNPDA